MNKTKKDKRLRRKKHIRKTVNGTSVKPRVYVFKSNKYFYAGIADDDIGNVIKSSRCEGNAKEIEKMAKKFAADMKKKKIQDAVFDRNGYRYHGLVALFAEGLRSNGINI